MKRLLAFSLVSALASAPVARIPDPHRERLQAQYEQFKQYDMSALKDVDLSRKHVAVQVVWGQGDDGAVLESEGTEILSRVGSFFDTYNITVSFNKRYGPLDSHNVALSFVTEDILDSNVPLNASTIIGYGDMERRIAYVKTSSASGYRKKFSREEFITFYTNLVAHELAHLFSLVDQSYIDDLCTDHEQENLMDSDHFREFITGGKRLRLSSEQELQLHSYLGCGTAYETSQDKKTFYYGLQEARHLRVALRSWK